MFFKFITPEQTEPNNAPASSARLKWLVAGAILLVMGVLIGGATWAALAIPTGRAEAAVLATSPTPSTNWQWQNPLPQGNDLNAVTCVTQDECYAVGDHALMKTVPSQNGNDWQPLNAGFTTTLTGVGCTAPGHCLAVGYYGTVLRTSDSGQTWISSSDTITASHHLSRVVCLNDGSNTCYAADYSNLFKTTDSGTTWATISLSTTGGGAITGLDCPDANTCYLIQGSKFSKTTDGGTTWATQPLPSASQPVPEQYSETSCPTIQTCYLVHKISQDTIGGPYGYYHLAKTTDGGITWATLYTPTTNPSATTFKTINCPDPDTCYAVLGGLSTNPTITKSTDGGQTWTGQDLPTDTHYAASPITQVSCITVTSCYAVGNFGKLYHTADGQQWQNELKGFFNTIHGIKCVDALNCYLISPSVPIPSVGVYTYTNYLMTTSDGGSTWVSQTQGSISGPPFGDMACPVINTCYVNGTGKIYKTSDGGQSWITLTNGITSTNLAKINCPSQQVCYSTVYTGSVIFGTTDGGQNWVSQAITASNTTAIDCPDVKICYAGWGTDVFKTTDGGQSWNYQAYITGTQNPSVRSLTCPTTQVCYAMWATYTGYACTGSLIGQPFPPCYASFKTSDGGQTWTTLKMSLIGPLVCPGVSLCYDGSGYTTDGGMTSTYFGAPIPGYSFDCPFSCTLIGYNYEIVSNFDPQQLNSLELSGPSRVTIGQPVSFTLRVKTAANTVASSYTGTVHFGSSDSQGAIPADYGYSAAEGGSHVFTVTFNTLGSQSLGVNDTFYTRLLKTNALVNVVPPCNPYSVTASSDDGRATDCGTLSYALSQAGIATSPVTITFASPVITLTSSLPTITPTVAVRIEGSCNLSGTLGLPGTRLVAGNNSVSTAITLTNGMSLNGVGVSGFGGYGVVVAGDNNTLTCNQVGPAGSYTGNGGGIKLMGSGNHLGLDGQPGSGNLIGGNGQAGILVTSGSRGNRAVYNRVGFGLDGLTRLTNGRALPVQPGGQLLVGPGNRFQS